MFTLNKHQAIGLANFFFDVAKGLVLAGFGIAVIDQKEIRFAAAGIFFIMAFLSIRIALAILKDVS